MKHNLAKAAKFLTELEKYGTIGKDRVRKAIQDGELTATRNKQDHYEIDQSELIRWADTQPAAPTSATPKQSTTGDVAFGVREREDLKRQLEELRERMNEQQDGHRREREALSDQVEDLRRRLDREGEERRALTVRLLPEPEASAPKRGLFSFLKSA